VRIAGKTKNANAPKFAAGYRFQRMRAHEKAKAITLLTALLAAALTAPAGCWD
jgi:hypothetical protein